MRRRTGADIAGSYVSSNACTRNRCYESYSNSVSWFIILRFNGQTLLLNRNAAFLANLAGNILFVNNRTMPFVARYIGLVIRRCLVS